MPIEIAMNIDSEYLLQSYMIALQNQVRFDYNFTKIMEDNSFRKTVQVRHIGSTMPDWVQVYYDKITGIVNISGMPPKSAKLNFDYQFYLYDPLSWDTSISYLI